MRSRGTGHCPTVEVLTDVGKEAVRCDLLKGVNGVPSRLWAGPSLSLGSAQFAMPQRSGHLASLLHWQPTSAVAVRQ